MEIPNYDSGDNPDKKYKQLFPYMPSDTFRMLICGNSGSGKTNLLYHMLIKPLLYFDEIYLYARNLEQDKYKRLMQKMRELSSKVGYEILGSTKTWNPESGIRKRNHGNGNGNGIWERGI